MPQKKSFDQKMFEFHARVQGVPFCQFFHSAKMSPLKPCMKFIFFFWSKDFFSGKYYESVYTKNINNVFQGPPNTGFRSVKVQTETFLKKDLRYFQKYFLFRIPMKLWQAWKANLEGALFWVFKIVKKNSVYVLCSSELMFSFHLNAISSDSNLNGLFYAASWTAFLPQEQQQSMSLIDNRDCLQMLCSCLIF